jgi:predicted ArsR family transcriptional regulator
MEDRRIMGRPRKRYNIRVRGGQREDIDADLLMQALLQIAEERQQGTEEPETLGDDDAGPAVEERP